MIFAHIPALELNNCFGITRTGMSRHRQQDGLRVSNTTDALSTTAKDLNGVRRSLPRTCSVHLWQAIQLLCLLLVRPEAIEFGDTKTDIREVSTHHVVHLIGDTLKPVLTAWLLRGFPKALH